MYFLENNYDGAYEWANTKENADKMDEAVVTGAILDLSHCCDLMDSNQTEFFLHFRVPSSCALIKLKSLQIVELGVFFCSN